MDRSIVHMDLDSFFVSVELLRRPELRNKPLIIGGEGDRGVVASCSYEARRFGVRSAMPSRQARTLCPRAIFIRGDMDRYSYYSRLVTEIIAEKAPSYEKASIDEFYLDISGMDRFVGCYKWALELKRHIHKECGLPLSFGLSVNKTISKIATNEFKPNGSAYIEQGSEKSFIAPLDVGKIPMIGEKTVARLQSLGVFKVGALSQTPPETLEKMFGQHGLLMWRRSNGIDHTPVIPYTERKSISTEETFQADTANIVALRSALAKMVEELGYTLRSKSFMAGRVTVKIRYSDFETHTRQASISFSASDTILLTTAQALFDRLYSRGALVRLLGVRLSELVRGHYQASLFEDYKREASLYQAMDKIRNKYGPKSIGRAL